MKSSNIFHTMLLLVFLISVSACTNTSKFLDVNVNPNTPSKSTVELTLPTAQMNTAYSLGNQYQITGGFWAQYWTQGPTANQYNNLDRYAVTASDFNVERPWSALYAGALADYQYVIDEATKTPEIAKTKGNHAAIAKLMQAYTFQLLTDLYGDIPFSEALKGEKNPAPRFDSQETVYNGLIKLIEEGTAVINEDTEYHPDAEDLIFHGDMHLWKKFANTLKLKVYMRLSKVKPAFAQAGIAALATAEFLETGEDAKIDFTTTTYNRNPLNTTFPALGTGNILASSTSIQYLNSTNDPRVGAFYKQATSGNNRNTYVGLRQGEGKSVVYPSTVLATDWSSSGDLVTGQTAPVIFISAAESYFLRAEAAVRGWLGGGNAKALYESGIKASFTRLGVQGATAFIAQPSIAFPEGGSTNDKIKAIITQKWVAMNGSQTIEAWTEWRRTGYPDFLMVSTYNQTAGKMPQRLPYPSSEVTRNANIPALKTILDPVWWQQ